ncbi:methionine adenosyltransferase [Candidatus Marinamargulisbacteria bacterium SCGC AG-343-D04]|nr:methionine adenosyltransferase [Candidatus Marinamargulisbacteria bacterium SCGC AG-343-D04]
MTYLFTSESVSEGHPDKICDQISDSLLDEALRQDPTSRVAVECFTTTGLVIVGGEVSTKGWLDVQKITRNTLREIGYTKSDYGIAADDCSVLSTIHEQSSDIAMGVNKSSGLHKGLGAGDQGIMFGHACTQTDVLMPLPIHLSHKLVKRLSDVRKSNHLTYLRPDSKSQVTVEYEGRTPKRIHTVLISTQHDPDVSHAQIEKDIKEHVLPSVLPEHLVDDNLIVYVNPTGRFVIGGPHGDAGLTGRKIIVDTYGGWCPHGGGAFSGKDSTKVDRSAAYMSRYIAKNMVSAGISNELLIQLSYAIGVSEPISIYVDTFGDTTYSNESIIGAIRKIFDLTPEGIIQTLSLQQPIFKQVSAYGHFGRDDLNLPWEQLNKVEDIKSCLKKKVVL